MTPSPLQPQNGSRGESFMKQFHTTNIYSFIRTHKPICGILDDRTTFEDNRNLGPCARWNKFSPKKVYGSPPSWTSFSMKFNYSLCRDLESTDSGSFIIKTNLYTGLEYLFQYYLTPKSPSPPSFRGKVVDTGTGKQLCHFLNRYFHSFLTTLTVVPRGPSKNITPVTYFGTFYLI